MHTVYEKTIYLIRHGAPRFAQTAKCYLGCTDLPLSHLGVMQAGWLQEYFSAQIQQGFINAVYHSPLQRCRDTAACIADGRLACQPVEALQEISMGQWECLPMEQIKREQPEAYWQRGQQMDHFCPPGGESFLQCQQRSVESFQHIVMEQPAGSSCIIVAHAGVNRCILSWIQQKSLKQLLNIPQPYGCINKLVLQQEKWQLAEQIFCPI